MKNFNKLLAAGATLAAGLLPDADQNQVPVLLIKS